jgi:alkylation response protein AidB-like acyl-CoA dehydrogenase
MSQHSSDMARIVFDNCRVPAENLIGEEGQAPRSPCPGWKAAASASPRNRSAWRAAFEVALVYAKKRESFGSPIFDHQAVQFRLAEMAMQIEAARQLILHAASMKDAGVLARRKRRCQAVRLRDGRKSRVQRDAGVRRLRLCRRLPLERIYRDVRVCQIYEGTSDIQKILIARGL